MRPLPRSCVAVHSFWPLKTLGVRDLWTLGPKPAQVHLDGSPLARTETLLSVLNVQQRSDGSTDLLGREPLGTLLKQVVRDPRPPRRGSGGCTSFLQKGTPNGLSQRPAVAFLR